MAMKIGMSRERWYQHVATSCESVVAMDRRRCPLLRSPLPVRHQGEEGTPPEQREQM
jgi:hypothetical protein